MKLNALTEETHVVGSVLITEAGYGRLINFGYDGFETDPSPRILYLGKYRHPKTGKMLVGGVNLNFLDDKQIERLRLNLRDILRSGRTLKRRWAAGNELLPDIFPNTGGRANRGAYRTYDSELMHVKSKGTITPKDVEREEPGPPRRRKKGKRPTRIKTKAKPSVRPKIEPTPEPGVEPEPTPEPIRKQKPKRPRPEAGREGPGRASKRQEVDRREETPEPEQEMPERSSEPEPPEEEEL